MIESLHCGLNPKSTTDEQCFQLGHYFRIVIGTIRASDLRCRDVMFVHFNRIECKKNKKEEEEEEEEEEDKEDKEVDPNILKRVTLLGG
ncbi:hypothetical protein M0804_000541 [Polistes exclamans]|nr:hypothetical protein M0804_000541 [Polistes exclamans]